MLWYTICFCVSCSSVATGRCVSLPPFGVQQKHANEIFQPSSSVGVLFCFGAVYCFLDLEESHTLFLGGFAIFVFPENGLGGAAEREKKKSCVVFV